MFNLIILIIYFSFKSNLPKIVNRVCPNLTSVVLPIPSTCWKAMGVVPLWSTRKVPATYVAVAGNLTLPTKIAEIALVNKQVLLKEFVKLVI